MERLNKGNIIPTYRSHPWHGVSAGPDTPSIVTCYVEIVPTDTVKFELDKESGILKVDRPQKYSNHCPTLYGFIPQTYCGDGVGALCASSLKRRKTVRELFCVALMMMHTERQHHLHSRSAE